MKNTIITCSLFLLSLSQMAFTQEKKDSAPINLSDIEVNANSKKLYSEMGRILTIIDKDEIHRSAVQSLDQLLDYVSGVDIRQRGTNGTQADISVRGGTFDQVLILLNGVNITDPQTGHFNLDIPLNLSDINRIEILQGSSARVLGPNAYSGAINIITNQSEKASLNAELVGGSFNYFAQAVSGNFGTKNLRSFASISHKSSDGYKTNTDFDISNAFIQTTLNTSHAGKFDLQLAAQLKDFGENGFYSLKYPNQREANKIFFSALDWTLNKGSFSYNAQVNWRQLHDRYELDYNNKAGYKYHMTDVAGAKISSSYTSVIGKTTIGVNVRNEHIFSNTLGLQMSSPDSMSVPFESNIYFKKEYNRSIYSGMIDQTINIGKWYLSAGIATSYCNDFGYTTYGGVDLGFEIQENVKFYTSLNSASRLPTFTDLFFANPVQQGNPLLKPEQSKTIELGLKINKSQWNLNTNIFYRKGENVIDWVKMNSSSKYESMNLSSINALGGEFNADYIFQGFIIRKINIGYSYLQLDKAAVGFDSKYALDYLKHKVNLKVDHSIIGKLSGSWKAGYFERAGTYDSNSIIGQPANIKNYTPFFMLDGRLFWNDKHFDIFADANNIFNTKYADYGGLTQPGINFNAGIRLKLN